LSRYSDINYILKLPAQKGVKLYFKALEQEQDKRSWDIFIHENHDKPILFDDWKKQKIKQYNNSLNQVTNTIVVDDARIQAIINKDKGNKK
jgi:hypothetical protein